MKPVIRDGIFVGSEFETAKAKFFFGSALLKREDLATHFPNYQFCMLKQVHGHQIVHAEPKEILEADGHFTGRTNQALVIQTADCIPLLLANNSQACALHAGWRGTASGIVGLSKVFFIEPPEVAVIGPHIRWESFEVGLDVAETLIKSAPPSDRVQLVKPHADPSKCYFNLTAVVKLQLLAKFPEIQIFDCNENTFISSAYHSYRRDKNGAGRQYSFVVLKS
jgi:YfiH family protein